MRLNFWFNALVPSLRTALGLKAFLAVTLAMTMLLPATSSAQGAAVTLEQARAEHESGRALLVDIREPDEHATGVTAGAQLLPMRQLSSRLAELPRDRPVLLICNTQNRSRATYEALRERGYTNLRYVNGGMSEWVRRGWPVVKPGR
jgi:rhodanese-related sulfurtransferase